MCDYLLIGEKLTHSFSKTIHEQINKYEYDICEVDKDHIDSFILEKKYKGINVTIPYKEVVMKHLDYISCDAKNIGAINTIINFNNKLFGFNTDYFGLRDLIKINDINFENKIILILGTGGTSKTAETVANNLNAKKVIKVSHNDIKTLEVYKYINETNIVINTTPVGMYPNMDESPIDVKKFKNLEAVIDVVYNPLNTLFVQDARKIGIKSINGLYMLYSQAIYSSYFFSLSLSPCDHEKEIYDAVEGNDDFNFSIKKYIDNLNMSKNNIYDYIYKSKMNIVLIGMPGVGKTTYAKELIKIYNKKNVDTDVLIENKTGKKIKELIDEYGESKFRDIESEVIKDLRCANNLIISTGGGAILRDENVKNLKYNGEIWLLNRDIDKLEISENRPLSDTKEKLMKIYFERKSRYMELADKIIEL